jgi:hypothetical protein
MARLSESGEGDDHLAVYKTPEPARTDMRPSRDPRQPKGGRNSFNGYIQFYSRPILESRDVTIPTGF